MANKVRFFRRLNPYLLVILSFILIILLGSLLLCMPFCQTSGEWDSYINTLFTATSATCVTGLHPYVEGIGEQYTFAGEIIVFLMIQIGGLGFITVLAFFITLFKGKLQFKDRFILSQMVNTLSVARVVKFVRKVFLTAIIIEIIGALLGMPIMFTIYSDNPGRAVWNSFFLSISAFNNAGFDLFGGTSLIRDLGNPILTTLTNGQYYYLLLYLSLLIILGGIGFFVIFDVISFKKRPKQWTAFTKTVLTSTAILLVFGSIIFLISDMQKGMDGFQCIFQSVTTRTAGFAGYNQDNLSSTGVIFSCLLMFIGGSPAGTAGGIKTITVFIIIVAIFYYFKGKAPKAFNRTFSQKTILKSMTLVFISLTIILISYIAIIAFEGHLDTKALGLKTSKELSIIFETCSAFGTVGLTIGITPYLTIGSKIILILLMFVGRIGPLSILRMLDNHMDGDDKDPYRLVEEDFLIG